MQTISEIRAILAERGIHPKHRLGQNFLHDKNQIVRLVEAAGVRSGGVVLEVGPGTGTLTEALLEAGAEVIACEIDPDMASIIRDRLDAVTLIEADCLSGGRSLNPKIVDAIGGRPFKLVANLPYQAASPLMSTLLIDHANCAGQFVTIQKEVADRLLASPGNKQYGPLGIIVQAFGTVKRIANVPPTCFWPQPKVVSAMVGIEPLAPGSAGGSHKRLQGDRDAQEWNDDFDRRAFARFVTDLFSKRRKQLGTIFGRDRAWPADITPDQRPEALTVLQLVGLHRSVVLNRLPSSPGPSARVPRRR